MAQYKVEMMDSANYHDHMMGSPASSKFFTIEAETATEAIETAKKEHAELIIVSPHNVKSVEEWAQYYAQRDERIKAEEEKRQAEKAKREARTKAKAEAMGLTVKQYNAKKRLESEIRKAKAEMERIAKELAEAERKLENLTEIY